MCSGTQRAAPSRLLSHNFSRYPTPSEGPVEPESTLVVCGLKAIPSEGGGIERGAEQLNSRLAALGWRITAYVRVQTASVGQYDGFMVSGVPCRSHKYFAYFTYMARVFLLLLQEHPRAIIHLHSPCVNGLWVPFLKALGFSVLIHSHGLEWRAKKWPLMFRCAMRCLELIGASFADAIVCVSRHEQEHFRTWLPGRRHVIHRIPNGVPPRPFWPSALLPRGLKLEPNQYYLTIGRLVPQKRLEDIITALSLSKSGRKLVIAGGDSFCPEYSRTLRALAGSDPRIVFAGVVPPTAIYNLLHSAFAYVHASEHEGCPNALLEAITAGCPCLVSDIPAHREIGGNSFSRLLKKACFVNCILI